MWAVGNFKLAVNRLLFRQQYGWFEVSKGQMITKLFFVLNVWLNESTVLNFFYLFRKNIILK
jgi:hypothetical protein